MQVDEAELARRRAAWKPCGSVYQRSFAALYQRMSAGQPGLRFRFPANAGPVAEPLIF